MPKSPTTASGAADWDKLKLHNDVKTNFESKWNESFNLE